MSRRDVTPVPSPSISSHRLPRICDHTIEGKDLQVGVYEQIKQTVPLQQGESILLLYMRSDAFESTFRLHDQCIVGITPLRIFKLEHGGVDMVLIEEIKSVSYQKQGLLHWDKVEIHLLKNQHVETMGISPASACKFFTNYLTSLVQKHKQQPWLTMLVR